MVKILSSLFFILFCEVIFILPGGIVEIALESIFSSFNENVISLIAFLCSGVVVILCLKIFFSEIFLSIKSLMQINKAKVTLLVATFIAIGLLYSLTVFLGVKLNLVIIKESSIEDTGPLNVLLLFIIAIVVAIVEEIVYRGADLSFLLMRLKPWVSILIISVVFSLGHVQYNGILPYITAFIYGILASVVVIKTNTLYWAISLHCGWNFAFSMNSKYFDINYNTLPYWGSTFELLEISILIIMLFSFWIYIRNHPPYHPKRELNN
jgi:membrane protease YdiL (CAAX protease family)